MIHLLMRSLRAVIYAAGIAAAAAPVQITDFGANPGGTFFYLYTPAKVADKPGILVAIHHCQGTATGFYNETSGFVKLADQYGFYIVYPGANHPEMTQDQKQCFDVHSKEALTHEGGGDPLSIVNMVRWTVKNKGADSSRVYVMGGSSGAMSTNVMLGSYPEVFRAGAAYSGVPFGCFAGTGPWNGTCAGGKLLHTPKEWGDMVRAAFPGYTGPRPRMQLWHGDQDNTLATPNFFEEIDQWTDVLGCPRAASDSQANVPKANWTHTLYKDKNGVVQVEAYLAGGVGHGVPMYPDSTLKFFGLDKSTGTALGSAAGPAIAGSIQAFASPGSLRFRAFSAPGALALDILSATGVRMATLTGHAGPAGAMEFVWDGKGGAASAPAGLYVAALRRDGKAAGSLRFALTL